jgi:hypothetical protein
MNFVMATWPTEEEVERVLKELGWDSEAGYCRHEWKEQILFSSTEVKCSKCGMDKDKYLEAIAKHKR